MLASPRQPNRLTVEEEVTVGDGRREFKEDGASQQELEQATRDFGVGMWDRRGSYLQRQGGWKAVACWKLVSPRMPGTSRPELRHLRFDTALATCVDQEEAARKVAVTDTSGLATGAKIPGMGDYASAYLDARWRQGVARLPSGATAASVQFSQLVLAALAGRGPSPPRPELVSVLFGQLCAAGSRAPDGGTGHTTTAGKATPQLDDTARADKLARQEQVVAPGTPREVLQSVLSCMSNTAGASFTDKLVGCRKSATTSLSSQLSVQTIAPAGDGSRLAR
jgi:hypothetical protein